eukprot:scaffold323088_cov45-Prasinocladus_malaysianus.AAC.1
MDTDAKTENVIKRAMSLIYPYKDARADNSSVNPKAVKPCNSQIDTSGKFHLTSSVGAALEPAIHCYLRGQGFQTNLRRPSGACRGPCRTPARS